MSNRLLSLAWMAKVSPTEKVVLAALADVADDAGVTWIAVRSLKGSRDLITMTSLSERAIQVAIRKLATDQHLTRNETPGRGVTYRVHPRTTCAPAAGAPPHVVRPAGDAATPAADAGYTTLPPIPSDADASSGDAQRDAAFVVGLIEALVRFVKAPPAKPKAKRAIQLPKGWQPRALTGRSAEIVGRWEPGRLERVLDGFGDHHTAKGSKMADWDAAWRTWIGNEEKFERNRRSGQRDRNDRQPGAGPINPMVRAGIAREARYAAAAGEDGEFRGRAAA